MNIGASGPVLRAFMASRERRTAIRGPYGSGKTFGSCQKILALMIEQAPNYQGVRPSRFMAIRNTYPDLMDTTVRDFCSVFEGLGKMHRGPDIPTFKVHFRLEDGTEAKSEMIFQALDREDHVRKLKGRQLTGIWLNEATELVKAVVDAADLRTGRFPNRIDAGVECNWHGLILDTNSCDTEHWYWKLAEEERPRGWAFFDQPGGVQRKLDPNGEPLEGEWEPNPAAENLENLPGGIDYYVDGMTGKTDDWIAVYLANEYGFSMDGRPVHPEYIDTRHTSQWEFEPNPERELIVGVDFGRTPAAALLQYDAARDRYVVFDEIVTENMSQALFGAHLRRYVARRYPELLTHWKVAWCDPAGDSPGEQVEETAIEILRSHGVPARPAHTNKIATRRASIAFACTQNSPMDGKPRLLVSPRCKTLRKGLNGGFCYRRMKVAGQERYTDLPDKNYYSHVCEALEYALVGEGEGREVQTPAQRRGRPRQEVAIL